MKTAPAFQFYASDAIADKRYRLMTLAERGLYLSMLNECWVNLSIPADPIDLAKWLGYPLNDIQVALTQRVLSFFEVINDELTSPELERYRRELEERRKKLSKAGIKGYKSKQDKLSNDESHPSSHPSSLAQAPRVEKGRVEKSKSESIEKGNNRDPWVDDYERASRGS